MTHAKKRNRVYVHPRRSGMLPALPPPVDERSGLICEWGDCEASVAPGSERCEAHQDRDSYLSISNMWQIATDYLERDRKGRMQAHGSWHLDPGKLEAAFEGTRLMLTFKEMRDALGHIASHYDDPIYVRKVALTAFVAADKVRL